MSGELAVLHGIACSLRADEGGMLGRLMMASQVDFGVVWPHRQSARFVPRAT